MYGFLLLRYLAISLDIVTSSNVLVILSLFMKLLFFKTTTVYILYSQDVITVYFIVNIYLSMSLRWKSEKRKQIGRRQRKLSGELTAVVKRRDNKIEINKVNTTRQEKVGVILDDSMEERRIK